MHSRYTRAALSKIAHLSSAFVLLTTFLLQGFLVIFSIFYSYFLYPPLPLLVPPPNFHLPPPLFFFFVVLKYKKKCTQKCLCRFLWRVPSFFFLSSSFFFSFECSVYCDKHIKKKKQRCFLSHPHPPPPFPLVLGMRERGDRGGGEEDRGGGETGTGEAASFCYDDLYCLPLFRPFPPLSLTSILPPPSPPFADLKKNWRDSSISPCRA